MVCSRSRKRVLASSVSSSSPRCSLLTFRKTMGVLSASALETRGGSASVGSLPIACDTRSRTSFAARSRSVSRSNSAVMVLRPSRLVEVSLRIPSTALTDASSGSVIWLSITSALAPAYEVLTVITAGSTDGYSRTPSCVKPIAPKIRMAMDITVASTGRSMLMEERRLTMRPPARHRPGGPPGFPSR